MFLSLRAGMKAARAVFRGKARVNESFILLTHTRVTRRVYFYPRSRFSAEEDEENARIPDFASADGNNNAYDNVFAENYFDTGRR